MVKILLMMIVLVGATAGCGTNDHDHGSTNDHTNNSHGSNNGPHHGTSGLATDTYADGLTKAGHDGTYEFTLVTATPGPPDVGDNTWQLRITDASSGDPIDDATVVIAPFMPAHGHGTSPAEFEATPAGDGVYSVGPFDLFMAGVWEVEVRVQGVGDSEDMAKFVFELEG